MHPESNLEDITNKSVKVITTGRETLKSALEGAGVVFPGNCGGKGECLCCRVQFTGLPPHQTPREIELLGMGSEFRMACQHVVKGESIPFPPCEVGGE